MEFLSCDHIIEETKFFIVPEQTEKIQLSTTVLVPPKDIIVKKKRFASFVYDILDYTPDVQPMYEHMRKITKEYDSLDKVFYREEASYFLEIASMATMEYIRGNHNAAFELLRLGVERLDMEYLVRPIQVNNVYRGRQMKKEEGIFIPFAPEDMLHIPFEKRYLVGNQRYSYDGMPCYYVSESDSVVKKELQKECGFDDESLSIARFSVKNESNFAILDLAAFFEISLEEMDDYVWEQFLTLWPLVVLSSLRFKYPAAEEGNISFRQEYILPQLLLELIIDRRVCNVSGIRYRSVHSMDSVWKEYDKRGTWNNYVFPAKENKHYGHSDFVLQHFLFDSFI